MDELELTLRELRNRGAVFQDSIFKEWLYEYACCLSLYTLDEVSQNSLEAIMLKQARDILSKLPNNNISWQKKYFHLTLLPKEKIHQLMPSYLG